MGNERVEAEQIKWKFGENHDWDQETERTDSTERTGFDNINQSVDNI